VAVSAHQGYAIRLTPLRYRKQLRAHVQEGSTIHTDEHSGYQSLREAYEHEAINHGAKEYGPRGHNEQH
jgi:hypothetical protein